MTTLKTDRLVISPMTLDDAELLFELDQDPMVMRYISCGRKTTRDEIDNVFLPRLAKYLNLEKGWGIWKVFVYSVENSQHAIEDDLFVGWILIRPMNYFTEKPEFNNLEIGWRFKQSAWGKGIATESARVVVDHLVNTQVDIKYLSAIADEQNLASINIMKKLGMKFIKKISHPDVADDVEVVLYSRTL
ncbi:GNAT family N-acetyltransferase [Shewanella pealeana]|nr:GNAT family N-acetyltransferase [Shewanella pealeana]